MKENTLYLSFLRVCSILWVVLIQHNFAPFHSSWGWLEGGTPQIAETLGDCTWMITALSMPLCMFISGYVLALTKGLERNAKLFFYKKMNRLLFPCILWGLVFSLLMEGSINVSVFWGGYKHLWFLWYLFVFFFVSFLLFRHSNTKIVVFILVLSLVMYKTNSFFPHTLFHSLCGYYCFFLLGFLLNNRMVYGVVFRYRYFLYFITLLALFVFLFWGNETLRYVYSVFGVLSVYFISDGIMSKVSFSSSPTFNFIDKHSFGVYIFHLPIMFLFYTIIDKNFIINNAYWLTTFIVLISIPLSCAIDIVTDRIKNVITNKIASHI